LKNKKTLFAILTIFLVLLFDQWLKIYVKTSMYYGQEIQIFGEWFSLLFVENEGMAFGWKIPIPEFEENGFDPLKPTFWQEHGPKVLLSSFRVVAVVVIGFYLRGLIKKGISNGLIVSISLIFAGALGNILDSALYGLIFTESPHDMHLISQLVPWGDGYTPFLTGDVVDMLRFDLFTIDLPWYGRFNFFAPIFNLADFAISLGVGLILFLYRKDFQHNVIDKPEGKAKSEPEVAEE
jgi:signal peptidase II